MLDLKITDSDIFNQGEPQYITRITRYGARGILFDCKGQVALMHMTQRNMYKLPGGGIEQGEVSEEAFMREIKEETGYCCQILSFLGTVEEHKSRRDFLHISYCFTAKTIGVESPLQLTIQEKQMGFTPCWVSLDQAIELMKNSIDICKEYGLSFTLRRDEAIIEYVRRGMRI